jgi:MoxR-like ATPase
MAERTLDFDELGALSTGQWVGELKRVGYYPALPVVAACRGLFRRRLSGMDGAQAMLLEGAPGVGKTYLGESLARLTGGTTKIFQFHAWADSSDLFAGVNVQAAVAGNSKETLQLGVLAQVARLTTGQPRETPLVKGERSSGGRQVILILDEIDKAPERVEALLLDWLQSGRVPIAPGRHLYTDLSNVIVAITSNDMRPLTDAFMRRVRRVQVPELPDTIQVEVLNLKTKFNSVWLTMMLKELLALAKENGSILSLQESEAALREIADLDVPLTLASASDQTPLLILELEFVLRGWVLRSADGSSPRTTATRIAKILASGKISHKSPRDLSRDIRRTSTPSNRNIT